MSPVVTRWSTLSAPIWESVFHSQMFLALYSYLLFKGFFQPDYSFEAQQSTKDLYVVSFSENKSTGLYSENSAIVGKRK